MKKCKFCSFKARSRYDLTYHLLMKHGTKTALILAVIFLSGCEKTIDKIAGERHQAIPDRAFYQVACCMEPQNQTLPDFLPQSHKDLCNQSMVACAKNQCLIGNDVYLSVHNDCGNHGNKIGDEYYVGKNY